MISLFCMFERPLQLFFSSERVRKMLSIWTSTPHPLFKEELTATLPKKRLALWATTPCCQSWSSSTAAVSCLAAALASSMVLNFCLTKRCYLCFLKQFCDWLMTGQWQLWSTNWRSKCFPQSRYVLHMFPRLFWWLQTSECLSWVACISRERLLAIRCSETRWALKHEAKLIWMEYHSDSCPPMGVTEHPKLWWWPH